MVSASASSGVSAALKYKKAALVVLTTSFGFALIGFDSGVFGGLTTDPHFLNQFDNPDATLLGFIVSIFHLGALAGALLIAAIGDNYGRRTVIGTGASLVGVGGVLQASASVLAHMLVGRVVGGFGLGIMAGALPVWQAEILPPAARGVCQALNLSLLIGAGINVAYWLDYGMYYVKSSASWRLPLAFQILYAIGVVIGVCLLPESPRWLLATGKPEQAIKNLAVLRQLDVNDVNLKREVEDVVAALELEKAEGQASWSEIFRNRSKVQAWNRVWIGIVCQAIQEFSGCNAIIYYASLIFTSSLGLERKPALLVSGGLQIWFFLSSFITWWTIDHKGRRWNFLVGLFGMTACLVVFTGCLTNGSTASGVVATIALYLFQTFFTIGWMSNLWVYPSEILPLRIRSRGNALATASQWLTTFAVVEFTPPAVDAIAWKTYLIFISCNVVAIVIVWFCFPETSGLQLEQVDLLFEEPTLFKAVQKSRKVHRQPVGSLAMELTEAGRSHGHELGKATSIQAVSDKPFK